MSISNLLHPPASRSNLLYPTVFLHTYSLAPYLLHRPLSRSIPTPPSCGLLHTYSTLMWLAPYQLHPLGLLKPTPPSCVWLQPIPPSCGFLLPTPSSCLAPSLLHPPGLLHTYSTLLACSISTSSSWLLHTYAILLCLAPYLLQLPGLLHTYSILLACTIPICPYQLHPPLSSSNLLHPPGLHHTNSDLAPTYSTLLSCPIPTPSSCFAPYLLHILLVCSIHTPPSCA